MVHKGGPNMYCDLLLSATLPSRYCYTPFADKETQRANVRGQGEGVQLITY